MSLMLPKGNQTNISPAFKKKEEKGRKEGRKGGREEGRKGGREGEKLREDSIGFAVCSK